MEKRRNRTNSSDTLNVDHEDLHFAAPLLSLENKIALGLTVPATIFVQDPLVARKSKGKLGLDEIHANWEPDLAPGPTNSRLAVVDYDGDTNELADPARWDEKMECFVFGPSSSPIRIGRENAGCYQFHQVNVWAVIQSILDFYEDPRVLGRPAPWAFEGNRLIVIPHAGRCENAFYDRHSKSLQFYYLGPKQRRVFTCLSRDIIAHETGHAILDGIRPYYYEKSSVQTAAFHEFIADLTAIVSALRNNKVRGVVAETTQGDLSKANTIADLAVEFGQAVSAETHDENARYFLRSAHNDLTMEHIEGELSPHRCSNVLTGAMFEILTKIANQHMEKTGESPEDTLRWATDTIRRIALQALDYLPPVDIHFIDYARTVLRVHELYDSVDRENFLPLMKDVFARRGLGDLKDESNPQRLNLRQYDIGRLSSSRTAAYHFLNDNRRPLCIPSEQDIVVVDLYATDKLTEDAARRPREIVIEYIWREDVELKGSRFNHMEGQWASLLCGGTLVFDGSGNVLYWVRKPGTESFEGERGRVPEYREGEQERGIQRKKQLLNYVARLVTRGQVSLTKEGVGQGLDVWAPTVTARKVDGTLRLEATSHLRHGRGY